MRVGDVLIDPRFKRVHVIYEVLSSAEVMTVVLTQPGLAKWFETPEALRRTMTVLPERQTDRDIALWCKVEDGLERWARQFVFGDVHVSVLPRV